jgi:uncharacterized membrane protein
MSKSSMRVTDSRLTSTVALVAASVWLGGILALGAIVAPLVFTMIPRPEAVEAMTRIFQRFDTVAVVCIIAILATEAWRAVGYGAHGGKIGRLDVARMITGAVGAVLVLGEAFWITPAIVALHQGGALRGLGVAGLELDRMHNLAETCGKTQVALALLLIVLEVMTLAPRSETHGGTRLAQAPREAAKGAAYGA